MSAHASYRTADGSPVGPALLAGVAVVLVAGGGLAWAAATAPPDSVQLLAWVGGLGVALFAVAVAVAVYCAVALRRVRERATGQERAWERWQSELARFEGTLHEVLARVRAGSPADDVRAPSEPVLRRCLDAAVDVCRGCLADGAQARAEAAAVHDDAARLANEWLPQVARQIREERTPIDQVRAGLPEPATAALRPVLGAAVDALAEGERHSAATLNSCQNAGARIQAATRKTLALIADLQHTYEREPAVLGDLMALDHEVSIIGRTADGIVVLSGGRTGRRWTKPIRIESILRGATSRIRDYRRIRVQASVDGVAVAGHAAEGVMHTLAELMDNATSFSPPPAVVDVYVEDLDAGVLVRIEDGGLGMRRRERERAQQTVSHPLDLATLPGTRLGLPVVGRLAGRHGMEVHFRPSARGGTGVVVMIPRHLVTESQEGEPRREPAPSAPVPAPAPAAVTAGAAAEAPPVMVREDGLPQRRRGATLEADPAEAGTREAEPEPATPRGNPGGNFSAFRRAFGPPSGQEDGHEPGTEPEGDAEP